MQGERASNPCINDTVAAEAHIHHCPVISSIAPMINERHEDACCPRCRLIQPLADQCRSCGHQTPLKIDKAPELFLAEHEGLWVVILFLWILPGTPLFVISGLLLVEKIFPSVMKSIGDAVAFPLIAAVLFGVQYSIIIAVILRRKKSAHLRQRLTTVPRFSLALPPDSRRTGSVCKISSTVPAHVTAAPCLASSLEFQGRSSARIGLRFAQSTDFILQRDGGLPVVVRGEVLLGPGLTSRGVRVAETRPLLQEVSANLPRQALMQTRLITLNEGDRVEIIGGEPHTEAVEELAQHYREGQAVTVLRGEPGRPILIQGITRS